jgi:hypothetical protein
MNVQDAYWHDFIKSRDDFFNVCASTVEKPDFQQRWASIDESVIRQAPDVCFACMHAMRFPAHFLVGLGQVKIVPTRGQHEPAWSNKLNGISLVRLSFVPCRACIGLDRYRCNPGARSAHERLFAQLADIDHEWVLRVIGKGQSVNSRQFAVMANSMTVLPFTI